MDIQVIIIDDQTSELDLIVVELTKARDTYNKNKGQHDLDYANIEFITVLLKESNPCTVAITQAIIQGSKIQQESKSLHSFKVEKKEIEPRSRIVFCDIIAGQNDDVLYRTMFKKINEATQTNMTPLAGFLTSKHIRIYSITGVNDARLDKPLQRAAWDNDPISKESIKTSFLDILNNTWENTGRTSLDDNRITQLISERVANGNHFFLLIHDDSSRRKYFANKIYEKITQKISNEIKDGSELIHWSYGGIHISFAETILGSKDSSKDNEIKKNIIFIDIDVNLQGLSRNINHLNEIITIANGLQKGPIRIVPAPNRSFKYRGYVILGFPEKFIDGLKLSAEDSQFLSKHRIEISPVRESDVPVYFQEWKDNNDITWNLDDDCLLAIQNIVRKGDNTALYRLFNHMEESSFHRNFKSLYKFNYPDNKFANPNELLQKLRDRNYNKQFTFILPPSNPDKQAIDLSKMIYDSFIVYQDANDANHNTSYTDLRNSLSLINLNNSIPVSKRYVEFTTTYNASSSVEKTQAKALVMNNKWAEIHIHSLITKYLRDKWSDSVSLQGTVVRELNNQGNSITEIDIFFGLNSFFKGDDILWVEVTLNTNVMEYLAGDNGKYKKIINAISDPLNTIDLFGIKKDRRLLVVVGGNQDTINSANEKNSYFTLCRHDEVTKTLDKMLRS